MKHTGINRKIDDLGRIVIPVEMRDKLGIKKQDQVEVFIEGDRIIITKTSDQCIICTSVTKLTKLKNKNKNICSACLDEMNNI